MEKVMFYHLYIKMLPNIMKLDEKKSLQKGGDFEVAKI